MFSRTIHVVAGIRTSFSFMAKSYSIACLCHSLSMCWWMFGLFPSFTFVHSAAVNIWHKIWVPVFNVLGYIPGSRIAGLYGNSVECFSGWLGESVWVGMCFFAWKPGDAQEMDSSFPPFFSFFWTAGAAYGISQVSGKSPQPQQCQIWAVSATYIATYGNARSLSHWMRPGMEPTSSWILVRFLSAEPQWESLLFPPF